VSGWVARQLPQADEVFLDHVGYFVADLDAAGRQLERLGFRVSLVNVQTNADETGALKPSGTSNRLARLRFGFIEILAVTHDTPLAQQFRQAIARYAGLHLIALSHDDIPATRERLTADGFAMQPVVSLNRRDRTLPDTPIVHFSVLRPQPGVMPEGRVQFVKPHTPGTVWREELISTANGVEGLGDMLLCVDDRAEAAARFGRYAGRAPVETGDMSIVALERSRLLFVTAQELAKRLSGFTPPSVPFMAGQALRCTDIAAARAVLEKSGITPLVATDELICVGPHDGLGAFMVFHGPGVAEPWSMLEMVSRR
jgi:catechol 2,3-dioxygenase-like lactoylglutathione lyase family enzyme